MGARLWNIKDCTCKRKFIGHDFWINTAVILPERGLLLTASRDHTLKLWRAATGTCELTIGSTFTEDAGQEHHVDFVTSAVFPPLARRPVVKVEVVAQGPPADLAPPAVCQDSEAEPEGMPGVPKRRKTEV